MAIPLKNSDENKTNTDAEYQEYLKYKKWQEENKSNPNNDLDKVSQNKKQEILEENKQKQELLENAEALKQIDIIVSHTKGHQILPTVFEKIAKWDVSPKEKLKEYQKSALKEILPVDKDLSKEQKLSIKNWKDYLLQKQIARDFKKKTAIVKESQKIGNKSDTNKIKDPYKRALAEHGKKRR